MKIFFGAAIQGLKNWGDRTSIYKRIIELLKSKGVNVLAEHTTGKDLPEVISILERSLGNIPKDDLARHVFFRDKMIEFVESDIDAAIFEVSSPSLGTGVEITHAYLRPRMGLKEVPILALYQKGYWQNNLSTMILGISKKEHPRFSVREYETLEQLDEEVLNFLRTI